MTIANAINDITVAQGGTASAGGRVTDALDALADALAGSDVPEGRTIEDNIAIVGQYIGGGGATFGALQFVPISVTAPEIGQESDAGECIFSISSGGTIIAGGLESVLSPIISPVAAGLTAVSISDAELSECDAYVCGVDEEYLYTSVEPWDGTVTVGSMELAGTTYATYTLTVPELDYDPETGIGEYLVLYVHSA